MRNIKNWKQNQTLKEMNETFRRATFDLQEVLVNLTHGTGGNYTTKLNINVGFERRFDQNVGVLEIYSEQGRCYSLYSETSIGPLTSVKIVLNITR